MFTILIWPIPKFVIHLYLKRGARVPSIVKTFQIARLQKNGRSL